MRVPRVYFVRSLSQATMETPSRFYANRVRARAKVRSDSAIRSQQLLQSCSGIGPRARDWDAGDPARIYKESDRHQLVTAD